MGGTNAKSPTRLSVHAPQVKHSRSTWVPNVAVPPSGGGSVPCLGSFRLSVAAPYGFVCLTQISGSGLSLCLLTWGSSSGAGVGK
jgi:hypothetical protein